MPILAEHIRLRKITFEFLRDFADAMHCYGFIAAHILDDTDQFSAKRAGKKSGEIRGRDSNQKLVFVARLLKRHHDAGAVVKVAVHKVTLEIDDIIKREAFDEHSREWFESLLCRTKKDVTLASSYQWNNLTKTKVKELLTQQLVDDCFKPPSKPSS